MTNTYGKSKVALVRCDSYDREAVAEAVKKAIDSIGGLQEIFAERENNEGTLPEITQASHIVLKPNLLAKADPDKAVTTHPEVFRAVAEVLQKAGYNDLSYGDSPGSPILNVEKTAEGSGIKAVADELHIPTGRFESGRQVAYPGGRAADSFVLCDEIADIVEGNAKITEAAGEGGSAGAVINICKMKTHQLERITGAVKNTFGCVYGINKAASHAKHATPETFAHMLGDLNRLITPRLHVMDGIVAMEGNGPGSGDPIAMNYILVSTDPVALDATFCHLIDLDSDLVPTHKTGIEYGIGRGDDDDVAVIVTDVPMIPDGSVMTLDEVGLKCGNNRFNVQRNPEYRGSLKAMRPFARFLEKKPVVVADKCVSCGICMETCPLEPKALTMKERPELDNRRIPEYDYNKCIKCYCCQEMCPQKAITVKKSFLARIADRRWKV